MHTIENIWGSELILKLKENGICVENRLTNMCSKEKANSGSNMNLLLHRQLQGAKLNELIVNIIMY